MAVRIVIMIKYLLIVIMIITTYHHTSSSSCFKYLLVTVIMKVLGGSPAQGTPGGILAEADASASTLHDSAMNP